MGGEAKAGRIPDLWVQERFWGDFRRFLAGCRILGSSQEVPESAGRAVEGFGEVPERFWELHARRSHGLQGPRPGVGNALH